MAKNISVVIPAYNEEKVIPELGKRIQAAIKSLTYTFEIIIVEHGSSDKTLQELVKLRKKDKRFKILSLAKNVGCDNGIMAGLSFAKGDAVIIMMADLQEPPELIGKFITKWEKGYDIVYAVVRKRKDQSIIRRLEVFLFYKIMGKLSNGTIVENSSDFRLIDRKVRDTLVGMPEHGKFFRGIVMWTGFRKIGIPFDRAPRFAGESKANFMTVFAIAINALFGFSKAPYQVQSLLFFITAFLTILALLLQRFSVEILAVILFITNAIMFIQNQYIVRIFEETRNRPQFIVDKKFGI